MKPLIRLVTFLLTVTALADVAPPASRFEQPAPAPEARPAPDFFQEVKQGVQITELGCMRAVFAFAKGSEELEARVAEQFSNVDFRVFPSSVLVEDRIEPKALHKIGNDRCADLVVFTKVTSREKANLAGLALHEAEATVQVYNPMSGELLVSHTLRADGKRHADPVVATRTAREGAVDAAMKEVILKTLEKAHKILVHEAQFKGVQDHQHLLEILEYTAKLKGVYHARQLTYDKETKIAVIEVIAAPQTESFWRAYFNNMPKREFLLLPGKEPRLVPNKKLREAHADWWKE